MTDPDDDGDPLLVRPYLLGEPGGTTPPASPQTWPEGAAEPVASPGSPDTSPPVPDPPPRRPRRTRLLLVLAVALVLVLAGAAGLVAALLPEPASRTALPVDIPLPSVVVSEPAAVTTAAPPAASTAATTGSRARATSSPTASSLSPAPSTTPASSAPGPASTAPPANRLAPPATDKVGLIHGNGGLCLDLNGAVAVDDNRIQVFTCNDTAAQVWTVAADGTMRVVGKCAVAADDGTVRITSCDGRRSAQWRTGDNSALVNLASEDCLTDPGSGARSGTGVRIEDCSGADRQRWQLP
jgi:hypothetical protein